MGVYEIEFAPTAERHVRLLPARLRKIVLDGVGKHLVHEAEVATWNRKPMRPNPLAAWELRLGDLRVYYRVVSKPRRTVQVAAIATKRGNEIWMGTERLDL